MGNAVRTKVLMDISAWKLVIYGGRIAMPNNEVRRAVFIGTVLRQ